MRLVINPEKALQIVIKKKNQIVVIPKSTCYTTNKYLFSSKRDEKKEVVILKLLLEIDKKQYKLDYYSLSSEKTDFLLFWEKLNKKQLLINSCGLKKKNFLKNINKYRKFSSIETKNYKSINNLAWINIIDYCRNLKMILNSRSLDLVSTCTGYSASKHILEILNHLDSKNAIDYEDLILVEAILFFKNFSTIRSYIKNKIKSKRLKNWVETWDCYYEKLYLELIKKGKCTGCVCDLPEFYDVKYCGKDLSHHLSKKFLISCILTTSKWKLTDDLKNYVKERLENRLKPYLEKEIKLPLSNCTQKENDTKPFFSNRTLKKDETSEFIINPTQKENDTKPFFSNRTLKKDETSEFIINPTQKENDTKLFFSNRILKKDETSPFFINPIQKEDNTKPFFSNRTLKKDETS